MTGLRPLFCRALVALLLVLPGMAIAQATVTLVMTEDQASEAGADTASFTVTRTGSTAQSLVVRLSGAGTATWNSDFTLSGANIIPFSGTSFQLTIPANQATATVTITPQQENRVEGQENFTFSISQDAAYVVGSPSSDGFTLEDDVAELSLEMTDAEATEAGPTTATLVVSRTNNGAVASPLAVRLSGSGTATWNSDFTLSGANIIPFSGTSFQLTIPANQLTATVTITPQQENRVEGQEAFTFNLAAPGDENNGYSIGAQSSDGFTLEDDVAELSLEMTDAEATEAGPTTATLVVSRTNNGSVASPLAVRLSGSGTATWNSDFTLSGANIIPFSGTSFQLTIPANQLTATVTITPQQDAIDDGEEDESFTFTLAAPGAANNGYSIGTPDSGTFIIRNFGPVIFKDGLESP